LSATISKVSYQAVESLTRFASKVPNITASTTTPNNGATNVPINQTISITSPVALDSTTVNNTNITIVPSVSRTISLQSADGCTVIIDPTSNLANNTSYTVTVTTAVRGFYGGFSKVVFNNPFTFSFTTVA
jgi:hypothetical protein